MNGVTVEVIRSHVLAAAGEMRRTLVNTSFNPVIYEVLDFGISIYDRQLRLIGDAPGLAFFLGANDYAIRKAIDNLRTPLEPGDVLLMNYPYWNSAHALDVTLLAPVFAEGEAEPFAYTCIRAHWMDLGAKDPGYVLDSTDMHQEGIIFPGTRICRRDVLNEEILDLIRFNSRLPTLVEGDLRAQIASTRVGQLRLKELYFKFGRVAFETAMQRVIDASERRVRDVLSRLPQGSWTAEDVVDSDGVSDTPVPMKVTVTLNRSGMTCDFTGSSDAVAGPINVPLGLTQTVCKFVLKSLTAPNAPNTEGSFSCLSVIAPEGSLFHARYPAATFTQWVSHLALELVYKALAQGMPDLVPACSGGDVLGFMMVGRNKRTGALYAVSNNDPVGWGATSGGDGLNATSHLSGSQVRNTPVEVLEIKTDMFVDSVELEIDSAGAGRSRGGLGQRRNLRFLAGGEFLTVTKRTRSAPWALAGGHASSPNSIILFPGTARERKVGTHRTAVAAGDRIVTLTGGGAGFGDPRARDPELVRRDVEDGYVSPGAAHDIYAVAISDNVVDEAATVALRSGSTR